MLSIVLALDSLLRLVFKAFCGFGSDQRIGELALVQSFTHDTDRLWLLYELWILQEEEYSKDLEDGVVEELGDEKCQKLEDENAKELEDEESEDEETEEL